MTTIIYELSLVLSVAQSLKETIGDSTYLNEVIDGYLSKRKDEFYALQQHFKKEYVITPEDHEAHASAVVWMNLGWMGFLYFICYLFVFIYAHLPVLFVFMYFCVFVFICIYLFVFIYLYIYLFIYLFVFICVYCIYLYLFVFICLYLFFLNFYILFIYLFYFIGLL